MSDVRTPKHVAIIMDGNRRWAREQGFSVIRGHRKVTEEGVEKLVAHCMKRGITHLTLWAWSTENWKRSKKEVTAIMDLFRKSVNASSEKLMEKGVRIKTIGDISVFDDDIAQSIEKWMEISRDNTKMTVVFALNYGGHEEILRAVYKSLDDQAADYPNMTIAEFLKQSENASKSMLEKEIIEKNLDTVDLPPVDLIIRPGGEMRLSGFLSWQSAYSELYFTDVLMPDFGPEELDKALEEFSNRSRRFGK
jgi:undecaprenyl diphosphate synthase